MTISYSAIPADLPAKLLPQIRVFVTPQDTSLLPHALGAIAVLLRRQPAGTFPEVERTVLGAVYPLAVSSAVSGPALDGVLAFFSALIEADPDIATRVVPSLTTAYEATPKGEGSPLNVARALAQVVKSHSGVAAATIAQFSKHVKVGYSRLDRCRRWC
jgi:cullin-associated NEDD8-dissociated protein 1